MAGVEAAVARAFAALLGPSLSGLAAEQDVLGASDLLEEGVAFLLGPCLLGPPSDRLVLLVRMD